MADGLLVCLRHLCERSALASTTQGYCQAILEVFRDTQIDAPFAAFYFINEEAVKNHDEVAAGRNKRVISAQLQLAGAIGIPGKPSVGSHPLACPRFNMEFGRTTNPVESAL